MLWEGQLGYLAVAAATERGENGQSAQVLQEVWLHNCVSRYAEIIRRQMKVVQNVVQRGLINVVRHGVGITEESRSSVIQCLVFWPKSVDYSKAFCSISFLSDGVLVCRN